MLQNPIFKKTTVSFDEESLLIKQLLCDEDEALTNSQSTPQETESVESSSKEPEPVESVKIDKVKVESGKAIKIESTKKVTKKKKQNKNGKLGITKDNNYAYIPNAPRKVCQNCSSSNHLTHACKKPVGSVPKPFYDCSVPLRHRVMHLSVISLNVCHVI